MYDIEWKIEHYEEVDSTNALLYQKISSASSFDEGYGIAADFQTNGRGQIGRHWHSEKSKNLLISFMLKPNLRADQQFILSQFVSIAIVELLTDYKFEKVGIKWPNDIYIGDLKIAGILIQNILKGKIIKNCMVGIGLNVNQLSFDKSIPNPTSMALLSTKTMDRNLIQKQLLEKINTYYKQIFCFPSKKIQNLYQILLYRRNVSSMFKCNNIIFSGKIQSVDHNGVLLIATNNGIESFNFRELTFII